MLIHIKKSFLVCFALGLFALPGAAQASVGGISKEYVSYPKWYKHCTVSGKSGHRLVAQSTDITLSTFGSVGSIRLASNGKSFKKYKFGWLSTNYRIASGKCYAGSLPKNKGYRTSSRHSIAYRVASGKAVKKVRAKNTLVRVAYYWSK